MSTATVAPLHTVRLDAVAPQPWKNGGGVTRALLSWGAAQPGGPGTGATTGATTDATAGASAASPTAEPPAWQLRVSVAEIAADGPFSAFAGVGRVFAVLRGAGVRLQFGTPGDPLLHTLDPASPALAFDGAQAPGCALLAGPTLDLNLMVQAAAGHGLAEPAQPGLPWGGAPLLWQGLYTQVAGWVQRAGEAPVAVPAAALCWWAGAQAACWQPDPAAADRTAGGDALAGGFGPLDARAPGAWWLGLSPHAAPAAPGLQP